MVRADQIGFQHQLDSHQDRVQTRNRDSGQYLRHDAVTAGASQQGLFESGQRCWHRRKRCPIAQGSRLALNEWDVMLPVILNMIPIGQPGMSRDHDITRHDHDLTGIPSATEPLTHKFARC
jgi:hypothetical protein